jgi:hypothetical protein
MTVHLLIYRDEGNVGVVGINPSESEGMNGFRGTVGNDSSLSHIYPTPISVSGFSPMGDFSDE